MVMGENGWPNPLYAGTVAAKNGVDLASEVMMNGGAWSMVSLEPSVWLVKTGGCLMAAVT